MIYVFNTGRSPVDGRGGQLEIAGMVVGRWGPNLSASGSGRGGNSMQPRVMSVGGPRRYGLNILNMHCSFLILNKDL